MQVPGAYASAWSLCKCVGLMQGHKLLSCSTLIILRLVGGVSAVVLLDAETEDLPCEEKEGPISFWSMRCEGGVSEIVTSLVF
jgi:hypothetical protein